jgi:hypothetical protein
VNLLDMVDEALSPVGEAFRNPLRLLFLIAFDRLKVAEVGNPVIHHVVVLRHAILLALAEDLSPLVLGGAALTHDSAPVEKVRTADVEAQIDQGAAQRLERRRVQCRILHMREGAAMGMRLMAYVNQVTDNELFSRDVVERVFSINCVHDDPTIGHPLPDEPDYHAFRAADRLWQLAEGFSLDLERNRSHARWAQLSEHDLAAKHLADLKRNYAAERQLYPATASGFFGSTMLRSSAAFRLYSELVQKRSIEYGLGTVA